MTDQPEAKIAGKVVKGAGQNLRRMIQGTLLGAIHERTGIVFYPGTLNVELGEPFDFSGALRIESDEMVGGDPGVSLVPCLVFGEVQGFVMREDDTPRPDRVVDVIAYLPLRDWFDLKDGDTVELVVPARRTG